MRPRSRPSRRSHRRSRRAPPAGRAIPRRSPRVRTTWWVAPSVDARQQRLEARLRPQRLQIAVGFHPGAVAKAEPDRFLEQLQRALGIALRGVEAGHVVEHHGFVLPLAKRLLGQLGGLLLLADMPESSEEHTSELQSLM